jgi:hypothetical protein
VQQHNLIAEVSSPCLGFTEDINWLQGFTGLESALRPARIKGKTISPSKPSPSFFPLFAAILVNAYN